MNASGVYTITNTKNGHRYIGSSVDMPRRWATHSRKLNNGTHENRHLQRAWNKYGQAVFCFKVIEECGSEMLLDVEQRFLDELGPEYNIAIVAGAPMMGRHQSPEHKAKIGEANKGRKKTQEQRMAQSVAQMGKKHIPLSAEIRAKLSALRKGKPGRKQSAESRAKISATTRGRVGKRASEETRRKISAGHLGQVPWNKGMKMSEEYCAAASLAKRGKPWTDARRQAKGRKSSAETRAKTSAALRAYWVAKKEARHVDAVPY